LLTVDAEALPGECGSYCRVFVNCLPLLLSFVRVVVRAFVDG
jgi:hypothetical protein